MYKPASARRPFGLHTACEVQCAFHLHDEQYIGFETFCVALDQFPDVFDAPFRWRVGEEDDAVVFQCDAFHFDEDFTEIGLCVVR